jgi:hypothetical protein
MGRTALLAGGIARTAFVAFSLAACPARGQNLPPSYGAAATAGLNIPEGQYRDEICVGNSFNPCIIMQNPVLSRDGTAASALLEGDYLFPGGPNSFYSEHERVAASTDLSNGELHLDFSGPGGHDAGARYTDVLYFDPTFFSGQDTTTLTFTLTLNGTYQGANIVYYFAVQSPVDNLGVESLYTGQGISEVQDVSSPSSWQLNEQFGDWSAIGPSVFTGQVTISAANPWLEIDSELEGGGFFADFAHTAHLDMLLPDGLTYTSASGVFLTAPTTPSGVPEPATWATMLLGFAAIGVSVRRKRATGALLPPTQATSEPNS